MLADDFINYIYNNDEKSEKIIDGYLKSNNITELKPFLKNWAFNLSKYEIIDQIPLNFEKDIIACYYCPNGAQGRYNYIQIIRNDGKGFVFNLDSNIYENNKIFKFCSAFDDNTNWEWIDVGGGNKLAIAPEYLKNFKILLNKLTKLHPIFIWRGLEILNYIIMN